MASFFCWSLSEVCPYFHTFPLFSLLFRHCTCWIKKYLHMLSHVQIIFTELLITSKVFSYMYLNFIRIRSYTRFDNIVSYVWNDRCFTCINGVIVSRVMGLSLNIIRTKRNNLDKHAIDNKVFRLHRWRSRKFPYYHWNNRVRLGILVFKRA